MCVEVKKASGRCQVEALAREKQNLAHMNDVDCRQLNRNTNRKTLPSKWVGSIYESTVYP